jgi:hypothetical protein
VSVGGTVAVGVVVGVAVALTKHSPVAALQDCDSVASQQTHSVKQQQNCGAKQSITKSAHTTASTRPPRCCIKNSNSNSERLSCRIVCNR